MKEPVAILVFAMVVFLGWEHPYEERYNNFQRNYQVLTSLGRMTAPGNNGSTPDALTDFDQNPAPDKVTTQSPEAAPAPVKTDSPGSWMWEKGKLDSSKQSGV